MRARRPDGESRAAAPWSLRWRLLAATAAAAAVAVGLAGWVLAGLFRDHVTRQFASALVVQLDQVTARLAADAEGRPTLNPGALSDPRWSRPYSGLYWQVDQPAADGMRAGVLRSRSLWDAQLEAPPDALADGEVHVHTLAGPGGAGGATLLLVERTVRVGDGEAPVWRVMVAGDRREIDAAVARFDGVLGTALTVLLALLLAAAVAQVLVGLAPLRALQRSLASLHAGRVPRLQGRFPAEVQPLVDDFNAVLARNVEIVERSRTQAGNLAHALKTPLAVMAQAAGAARAGPAPSASPEPGATLAALAALVDEQVALARRHVDWHLARARAAAAQGLPGTRTGVAEVVAGLVRVMTRIHAARGVRVDSHGLESAPDFAGEAQDLQEMLGNLLDNACKWARGRVHVSAAAVAGAASPRLRLMVEDDGPGIDAARRAQALERGTRLDEAVPGSGLGLSIVQEIAALYGGTLDLGAAEAGGLRAVLDLPAASTDRETTC